MKVRTLSRRTFVGKTLALAAAAGPALSLAQVVVLPPTLKVSMFCAFGSW